MVAVGLFQLELFAIDNNCRDLLVHEDENGGDDCGHNGHGNRVNRVVARVQWHDPRAVACWLCKTHK